MQYEQVVYIAYIAQITICRLQIVNCAIYAICSACARDPEGLIHRLQVTGCRLQVTDYKFQVIGLMLKNISEIKNLRKLLNALTLKLIVLLLLKFMMDLFSECGYSCLQLLMPLISID